MASLAPSVQKINKMVVKTIPSSRLLNIILLRSQITDRQTDREIEEAKEEEEEEEEAREREKGEGKKGSQCCVGKGKGQEWRKVCHLQKE